MVTALTDGQNANVAKSPTRIAIYIALSTLVIVIPTFAMTAIGYQTAGATVSLSTVGIGMASAFAGIRLGAWASLATAALSFCAMLAAGSWLWSSLVMIAVSLSYAITARWGWRSALILLPIALGFVVADPPVYDGSRWVAALLIAAGTALFGLLAVGFNAVSIRPRPTPTATVLSPSRTWSFAVMLTVVTTITTLWAVIGELGHTGGWLIMTPFIVILPYVQDAWVKSGKRIGGTLIGVAVAYLVGLVIPWQPVLYLIVIVLASLAFIAKAKQWDYIYWVALLTPTIVILEGTSTSVDQTAISRLLATLGGVALSLIAIALAAPLYRRRARELDLDRY